MSERVNTNAKGEVPSLSSILKGADGTYEQGKTLPGMDYPGNLLCLLLSGTGLNKWNIVATYPTRQCGACLQFRGVQHFVRSATPYGRLETNRAGCNTCKYKGLDNGLTLEDFARMYLGFEGVWDAEKGDEFFAALCPKLWVPKKEKKFYAGTSTQLWSPHTDEKVQAKLADVLNQS